MTVFSDQNGYQTIEWQRLPRMPLSKRILDLAFAITALILLSPILSVLALLIRISIGRPVLFRQLRPGLLGRPFTIYKFRTMTETDPNDNSFKSDEMRITPIGALFRRWSLDELPELFNIIKGDMSLVGPRPLLMEYLSRYSPEQARRMQVRPGITGWAQINGRNLLSWEEKFRHDVWYVDNWSFFLDLKILMITIFKTLRGEGITAEHHATMPEFYGNHK